MGVDIQDFNKNIQKHLPTAIHAQSSSDEDTVQKKNKPDNIIQSVAESPQAIRSALSYKKVNNVVNSGNALAQLSGEYGTGGNGTLTVHATQPQFFSGN